MLIVGYVASEMPAVILMVGLAFGLFVIEPRNEWIFSLVGIVVGLVRLVVRGLRYAEHCPCNRNCYESVQVDLVFMY